jgi:hypothetical protein
MVMTDGPRQIHPRGHSCRWCDNGTAVPLDCATAADLGRMLLGEVDNQAEEQMEVVIRYRLPAGTGLLRTDPIEVVVTAGGEAWALDADLLREETGLGRWRF